MNEPAPHRDADGEWWTSAELPNWWVRAWPDGTLQARHMAGYLADVEATSWTVLAVLAQHRSIVYVHDQWAKHPPRQMGGR